MAGPNDQVDNKVLKLMEQSPLPQMIHSLAQGLADAQYALTKKTAETLAMLSDAQNGIQLPGEEEKRSLLELGFQPSFLHISEATITARLAFTQTESTEKSQGASATISYGILSATVDAKYSAKYSFETTGSSEIRTKIISVPAPLALSEKLQSSAKKKKQST